MAAGIDDEAGQPIQNLSEQRIMVDYPNSISHLLRVVMDLLINLDCLTGKIKARALRLTA